MPDRQGMTLEQIKKHLQRFGLPDYLIFFVMLVGCVLIGVYFGFINKKPKVSKRKCSVVEIEEDDYLVGGRNMKIFPVAMSLIASYISGISLLGTPTEIYVHGIQFFFIIGGLFFMGLGMMYIFLPVFHDLKLTSTYQYLQRRFDNRIRLFGSTLFTLAMIIWLPIVIYVPALCANQVTGVNVHLITPIVCIVCIFYTCVGGMKAVVWTDVIQTIIMFGAMLLICIKGTYDVGGIGVVIQRAYDSGRIETPATAFDLTIRHSYWSLIIGAFPNWLKTNAVSQNMIQRYLSLPTKKAAIKALWSFIFGVIFILSVCCYSGLLIYATYYNCDPLTTKLAVAKDQLLPLLVMDVLGLFPGLPGLFVAGVFSAALSSLSTGLNSMSAVILEDFCKPYIKKPLTENQTRYIMRGVVVVFGAICVGLVFVVEHLGSVLQLSISLGSISNGPLLGIFTLGVLVPWVHATGCLWGGIAGLSTMTYIVTRAQTAIASGEIYFKPKPVYTDGCTYTFMPEGALSHSSQNLSLIMPSINEQSIEEDIPFAIHRVSYLFYTLIGSLVTIIVAVIVSFCTGANNPNEMDEALFAPFIRGIIRKNRKNEKKSDVYVVKETIPIECKVVQQKSVIIEEDIDLKNVSISLSNQ